MRLITLLLVCLMGIGATGITPAAAQSNSKEFPLKWVTTKSGASVDSETVDLPVSISDTSQWIAGSDSSAANGGMYASLWSNEDTVQAKTVVEWAVYDPVSKVYRPHKTTTATDSLVSGYHTGALKNPVGIPLAFRKPPGMTHWRVILTTVTTLGQWPAAGGTGTKAIPKLRGKVILPK